MCAAAGSVLLIAPAMALDVSGPIVSNTTWAIADSPINVVADVEVGAGAQLTIEPGVQVRFAAQTLLTLQHGSIRAVGSASVPIIFDSALANPAAGDWGPIRIEDDSLDATTTCDSVVVRHGKGVVLHRASPTLNRIAFENNQGAAMSLDLESSPTGVGLTATGNGLNGISIPPGTITGSVRWGLVGIPYVVAEGIVTIGLPPMTLTPTTLDLREGQQASLTLQLAKPAPSGGLTLDVVSSAPNVASVAGTLTLPAGSLEGTVAVSALAAGQTTVTVSRLELGAVSAAVTVRPPIALSIVPATATLAVGQTATLSVQLSEPAPASGVTIALNSSNAGAVTVPSSLFVAAGFSSVSFPVQGVALGTSALTASASGYISATASVQVRNAFLSFSPLGIVQPGTTRSLTITLSEPAPAGGVTIFLSSSQSSVISVPPQANVAAGGTSVTVNVVAGNEGSANLSATAPGYEPASVGLVVQLIRLSFDPASAQIPVGTSDRFVLRLNRPAMAGGLIVTLSSSDPASASVTPSEIVIPEGRTAASIPVEVSGLLASGSATVRAESAGVQSGLLSISVGGPASLRFDPAGLQLGRDTRTHVRLTRRSAGGGLYPDRDAWLVTLANSDPARLNAPTSISIPAGESGVDVPLTASAMAINPELVTVTASAANVGSAPLQISIPEPAIVFLDLDNFRGVGSRRDSFYVALTEPWNARPVLAVHDLAVGLGIAESDPPDVVSGLFDAISGGSSLSQMTIPAGRGYAADATGQPSFGYVATPDHVGSYQVSAQIGAGTPSLSGVQVVTDTVGLAFSTTFVRLADGLQSDGVSVQRLLEGVEFYGADPLTVTLTVSEPGKVDVPVTVEIPADEYSVVLPLVGLDVTSAPVTIQAQAVGYAPPTESLSVMVDLANVELYLNSSQEIGGPRNQATVSWNSDSKGSQMVSPVDRPATVTLVDLNPAGIVSGLYAGSTGPDPIGPLVLRAGDHQLTDNQGEQAFIYIGSPTAAGTYRVNVDVPGFGNWDSDLVTVEEDAPLSLSFFRTSLVVGHGLRTQNVRIHRSRSNIGQPLVVELASSAPDTVSLPAQVVIPAGEESVPVPVSGLALTAVPVAITAQVQGNPSLTATMSVTVVNPAISFRNLREQRSVGSERDAFSVLWVVPGSNEHPQVGSVDTSVALNIIDSPNGVITALYAASSGGTTRNTLVIREGQSESTNTNGELDQLYVGAPTTIGSYRMYAAVAGLSDSPSNQVTVSSPALRFSRAIHDVGMGLRASAVSLSRTMSVSGAVEPAAEDLIISLNCAASSVCQVPTTVTIPAGQTTVVVPISGMGLGSTRLTASAPGYAPGSQPDVDVRVVRPRLRLAGVPELLRVGQSATVLAVLDVPTSTENPQLAIAPISVTLTSSFPSAAGVSPTVLVPAGGSQSNEATLQGLAPGVATLTPSAPDGESISSNVWIVE